MKNNYANYLRYVTLFFVLCLSSGLFAQTTVTIQATGSAGSFNTGSVNAAGTKNDGDMITINQTANRGWAEFDLSSIPANAVVSAVTANFTTYSSVLSTAINNLYGFTGDPAVIPGATLYTNCGQGTSFNATSWTANALQTKVLNATGIAFVDANCGASMCLGYVRGSTNTYNIAGYGNVNGPRPELVITYTVPTPCSGMPNPGTATITSSAGCPNVSFNLGATGVSADSGITYQWQSGPTAAGPWSNIIGATTVGYTTSTSTTTFYQLVTTCGVSGLSNTSSIVSYTVSNPGPCLCSAYTIVSASNTADEDMGNVTVGTMNNTTTCASLAPGAGTIQNRYSNYAGSV
ncbi:MAG TPA: hypothetical protein VK826_04015, partial [Bacteroidia bacterium]|nr:hypothetical protein [Bacteroidia bacterium]